MAPKNKPNPAPRRRPPNKPQTSAAPANSRTCADQVDPDPLDLIGPIEPIQPFMPAASYGLSDPWGIDFDFAKGMRGFASRSQYCRDHGWHLVTQESLQALIALTAGKSVLDAGSGTGFLADRLARDGTCRRILAADLNNNDYGARVRYRMDFEGDACTLLPGDFDVVLLCWPSYDKSFGADVAKAMKIGQILAYQGEGRGGCTADDEFFELLDACFEGLPQHDTPLNASHVRFPGIHDRWSVFQKVAR